MHLNDFDGTKFGDLDTLSIQNKVFAMKFMLLYPTLLHARTTRTFSDLINGFSQ